MIISHAHRFVFIKTSKTAGTSIEIGLSQFCGASDVITTILPPDQALRRGLGYPGPQNHLAPWWDYRVRDVGRLALRRERLARFTSHMSATDVRTRIGDEMWDDYFTFCFERNPFERTISQYHWWAGRGLDHGLSSFIDSGAGLRSLKMRGSGLYRENGEIIVDKVYRYEDLVDALEDIRRRLALPAPVTLPRAKGTHRTDRRPYAEVLTPEHQDRIRSRFSEEIRTFGYED